MQTEILMLSAHIVNPLIITERGLSGIKTNNPYLPLEEGTESSTLPWAKRQWHKSYYDS